MGCYEQPAITAITPVMAAPITLSGDKDNPREGGDPVPSKRKNLNKRKKENGQRKGGMGERHAATTQGF